MRVGKYRLFICVCYKECNSSVMGSMLPYNSRDDEQTCCICFVCEVFDANEEAMNRHMIEGLTVCLTHSALSQTGSNTCDLKQRNSVTKDGGRVSILRNITSFVSTAVRRSIIFQPPSLFRVKAMVGGLGVQNQIVFMWKYLLSAEVKKRCRVTNQGCPKL